MPSIFAAGRSLATHSKCVGARRTRKKFRFKNKLVSLDSSVIDLSLSLFDWAQFRRTKGAVKLHLLLDHDGYLPSFAVVTNGKTSDIRVARKLRFERGTVVVMDRGYIDYEWFVQLTHQSVYFVTRLKDNASFEVVERRPVPAGTNILKDQIVFFHGQAVPDQEHFFRIVEVWDADSQRSFTFLTNNLVFAAGTIAAIYKDRWQVELFFDCVPLSTPLYVIAFQGSVDSNCLFAGPLMNSPSLGKRQHPPHAESRERSRMLVWPAIVHHGSFSTRTLE